MAINRIKYVEIDSQKEESDFVKFPSVVYNLGTLNATENKTYLPEEGINGWNRVNVNVPLEKCGVNISDFIGDVDANGVLQAPNSTSLTIDGDFKIGNNAFLGLLAFNPKITTVTLSDKIKEMPGMSCFSYFGYYSAIESFIAEGLETIRSAWCFQQAFGNAPIQTVSFPKLKEVIGTEVFNRAFMSASIRNINFNALERLEGGRLFANAFSNISHDCSLSFPALTYISSNDCFSGMFNYSEGPMVVHFRSDMQSRIEEMDGYSTCFGATNGTILFDL